MTIFINLFYKIIILLQWLVLNIFLIYKLLKGGRVGHQQTFGTLQAH